MLNNNFTELSFQPPDMPMLENSNLPYPLGMYFRGQAMWYIYQRPTNEALWHVINVSPQGQGYATHDKYVYFEFVFKFGCVHN